MDLLPNARFGTMDQVDWCPVAVDQTDDDMELAVTPDDVIAMLGFDPLDDNITDANPYHEPAGSEKGGQFASKGIGQSDLNSKSGDELVEYLDKELTVAGDTVDGLEVMSGTIPNQSSIDGTLTDYEILDGVREVPMSLFDETYLNGVRARKLDDRTTKLMNAIKESGKIMPLIVAIDPKGGYIIEGGHRFDSLIQLGKKSVAALVVVDKEVSSVTDANPYHEPAGTEKGGRFASKPGGPELNNPEENDPLYKVQEATVHAARDQGYPLDKLVVETEPYNFTVGDRKFTAGGAAWIEDNGKYPKGTIAIYSTVNPENIPGIMAHEIMHQKFQQVFEMKQAAYAEIGTEMNRLEAEGKDPWGRLGGVLKPDGTVREAYKGRWPAYELMTEKLDNSLDKLEKEDGVSDYSRAYWDGHSKGKVSRLSAVHETLAEMAKNEFLVKGEKRFLNPELDGGKSATGGAKVWRDLYGTVQDLYKRTKQ